MWREAPLKATTSSTHWLPVASIVCSIGKIQPIAPNRAWTADSTYIAAVEGWLYLTVVLNLLNREIVGWSGSRAMTVDIVNVCWS